MHYEPCHVELTMDPKGRVTLPQTLRMMLRMEGTNQLVAIANEGDKGGISLFTQRRYRELLLEKTAGLDPFDPYSERMLFLRSVVSTNHTLTIDTAGRILLSPRLRELAALDSAVILFSLADWFEIWDAARWRERHPALVRRWQSLAAEAASLPHPAPPPTASPRPSEP